MELLALHQLLEVLQNVAVIVQVTSSAKNEVLGTEQKKKLYIISEEWQEKLLLH